MTHYIDGFPGRVLRINNENHLYFGGTAYLGLQTDPEFQALYMGNIKKFGTSYGASRKSNVRMSIFDEAEHHLADYVGCEACLTLSSGYLAAQFVVRHFQGPDYALFYAPNSHSSLFTAADHSKKPKPYSTISAMNLALRELMARQPKVTPVVLFDTIDPSGSHYPDFESLRSLPLDRIVLVADDSHGIGIVGSNGNGSYLRLAGLQPKELIVCCSLGKGFAIQAGAVFGPKKRLSQWADSDFFGGASPPSPAGMACLLQGQDIFVDRRARLQRNIAFFLKGNFRPEHFQYTSHHPAIHCADGALASFLEEHRIIITNFIYNNEGISLSRIVLGAHHNLEDIRQLLQHIANYPFR